MMPCIRMVSVVAHEFETSRLLSEDCGHQCAFHFFRFDLRGRLSIPLLILAIYAKGALAGTPKPFKVMWDQLITKKKSECNFLRESIC